MVRAPATNEPRLRTALSQVRKEVSQQDRWRTALAIALSTGDLGRARHVVHEAARDLSPVVVLDAVVAPAMHDIGSLWERAEITIADEHLATFAAHRLLAEVAGALQIAEPDSREAVLLAVPPSERHTAGLLMAHDVLQGAGYVTLCLGPGVPMRDFADALEQRQPALVGLSATMPFVSELREAVDTVSDVLPEAQVLLGGGAAAMASPPTARSRVHPVRLLAELLGTAERALSARSGQ